MKKQNYLKLIPWPKSPVLYLVPLAYLIAGFLIYSYIFSIESSVTRRYLNKNVQGTLQSISDGMNLKMQADYLYARNLSKSTLVIWPMYFHMYAQMRDYFPRLVKSRDLKGITLTDASAVIVYSDFFEKGSKAGYPMKSVPYFQAGMPDPSSFHFYFPLKSEGDFCGSLSLTRSIEDFAGIFTENARSMGCDVFLSVGGKIRYLYPAGQSRDETPEYLSRSYKCLYISVFDKSGENLVGDSRIYTGSPLEEGIILGFPQVSFQKLVFSDGMTSLGSTALILLVITILAVTLLIFLRLLRGKRLKTAHELRRLSRQRESFIQHVSVVSTLVEENNPGELKEYIHSMNDEISFKSALIRLNHRAAGVLIAAKEKLASELNIPFNLSVKSPVDGLKLKSPELCSLLGNLIDNALEAVQEHCPEKGFVNVDIYRDETHVIIRVENSGELARVRNPDKLFEPGFTTKRNAPGRGMGLYIVSEILTKYKGSIEVKSRNGTVIFSVHLPV